MNSSLSVDKPKEAENPIVEFIGTVIGWAIVLGFFYFMVTLPGKVIDFVKTELFQDKKIERIERTFSDTENEILSKMEVYFAAQCTRDRDPNIEKCSKDRALAYIQNKTRQDEIPLDFKTGINCNQDPEHPEFEECAYVEALKFYRGMKPGKYKRK